ncbi:putative reverse transcriptase domain-containing protein [Tanacetum coccineum]
MSSATSTVTYTSVYTNSEPNRAFWRADDEEISEGGILRVIVLGYDRLPMQAVAPPSPDYIPDLEDIQTPPVPQDEDDREPMFVQAHDPDYVPEPIYPEYIPLEDEHEFPAKEQPLPPVDSPIAESPEYVTESDFEEDPEEYEDDETEDGSVEYPIDGGDDRVDDDGYSSGDDADGEDKDDEEEEEEHLASGDSAIVIPVDEPVFPSKGIEPVIPPPSTDITIRARITVRPQTSISLLPEAEVERLLAMTTPSPSPPISLLPPSAGERLARIASIQALIDAVTAALPSPPLPPSLYIPPLVDRKNDILESEQPPRKRLCLSTLGSRYEVGESSTTRPTRGRGIDYGFVSTVEAKERRHRIRDVGYDIRDTWVVLAEAELLALREQQRRARPPGPEARIPDHQDASGDVDNGSHSSHRDNRRNVQTACPCFYTDFMKCQPLNFKGTEGVVGLTWWIEKMESVFNISGCAIENQFVANETKKVDKYINGLPDNIYGNAKSARPKTLDETIELANDLMDQKLRTYAERQSDNKRKADDSSRNNHGHQQQPFKRQNFAKVYNMGTSEKKPYGGSLTKSTGNTNVANTQKGNREAPKGNVGNAEKRGDASGNPDADVITGTFLLNNHYASILFYTGANRSFISTEFSSLIDIVPTPLDNSYDVELADGKIVGIYTIIRGFTLNFLDHPFNIDLIPVELGSFDIIIGMDWLRRCQAMIVCDEKLVQVPYRNETLTFCGNKSSNGRESRLTISAKKEEDKSEGKQIKDVPIVRDFPEVFLEDLPGLPLARPVEFQINLIP